MYETLMHLLRPEIESLVDTGRKTERSEVIQAAVRALRGLGHSDAEIRTVLQKYFHLSKEEFAQIEAILKSG